MKGYRTLALGILVAVFGALTAFDWQTVVTSPQALGYINTAIGIATVVLRYVTDTPVGQK